VYAPAHPGAEDPADLTRLDDLWDLVLYYDELFDRLGLGQIDLVGHSFGGMVAAEIAATYPARVRRLVLLDAMGLWRDDAPVQEHVTVSAAELNGRLYSDPEQPEVAQRLVVSDDLATAQAALVRRFSATAATVHFTHPIPERGLHKRLHRIRAATLVLWGAEDTLVPPVYADEFAQRITGARAEVIPGCAHYPYLEQRAEVTRRTLGFLNG
jgi:pimeloyl-ACP methyl ester carboxylesterase